MTFTQNKTNKHQGGDFILEGNVKRQKTLASKKGLDTEKMWRTVLCRLAAIMSDTSSTNLKINVLMTTIVTPELGKPMSQFMELRSLRPHCNISLQ